MICSKTFVKTDINNNAYVHTNARTRRHRLRFFSNQLTYIIREDTGGCCNLLKPGSTRSDIIIEGPCILDFEFDCNSSKSRVRLLQLAGGIA